MDTKTVKLPVRELAEHAIFLAIEQDELETCISRELQDSWEDVTNGDLVRGITSADWEGDSVWFEGEIKLQEVVDYIPAGPNRGYGPINPPEWITEDRECYYTIRLWLEEFGHAEMYVESY